MKHSRKDIEATLRAWRPTLPSELASATPEATKSADQLITAAFSKLKLDDQLGEAVVMKAWAEIVGPFLAQQTRPRGLQNGVLVVSIANSALLSQLRVYLKPEILKKLRARLGSNRVRDIAFRLDG